MSPITIDDNFLTILKVLAGGVGIKAIEKFAEFFSLRKKNNADDALSFRNELRQEVKDFRTEMHNLEKELDQWRDRYYALQAEYTELKGRHSALCSRLNDLQIPIN